MSHSVESGFLPEVFLSSFKRIRQFQPTELSRHIKRLNFMGPELRWLSQALRSHRGRLGQPFKITFAVTYACQSGCKHCNIWKRKPSGELTVSEIRKIFRSVPALSWVDLTGGEPFLRPDLEEITEAVLQECPNLALLHLPTNGLESERIERGVHTILAQGPRRLILTVSCDGPPELNVALRGHPEAWTASLDTFQRLRSLRSSRFDVLLGATLSADNVSEAHRIYSEAKKVIPTLQREDIHWNLAQESPHYYGNDQQLDPGRNIAQLKKMRQLAGDDEPVGLSPRKIAAHWNPMRAVDRSYRAHLAAFLDTQRSPVACRSLHSTAFLDPMGVLYPCITWDNPLGNLRENNYDLRRLWSDDKVSATAKEVRSGNCPQCWTPCEAVPALLGDLPRLVQGSVARS